MADRKISDLTALTTPAAGDYLPIVDISEAAAASKNKRITVEELMRGAPDGTAGAPGFAFESDPNSGIYSPGADQVAISTGGSGRLFIDGSGNVGIGVTDPSSYNSAAANLVIGSTTANSGLTIRAGNAGVADRVGSIHFADGTSGNEAYRGYIAYEHSNDSLGIGTSGLPRLVIDSSGRLLVGTSSARSNFFNSTVTAGLQLEGTADNQGRSISVVSSSATASHGGQLFLAHQKSGAVEGNTTLADGDRIGLVSFQGSDGTNFIEGARVSAEVDGGVSTGDLPSRLVFSTTADGASSPTERLRITSTGQVRLAGAGITFNGDTAAANELDDYEEGTWTPTLNLSTTQYTAVSYNSWTKGYYRKVGSLVHIQGVLITNGIDFTAGAGNVRIGGLPFASPANASGENYTGVSSISVGFADAWTSVQPSTAEVLTNSSLIALYAEDATGERTALTTANVTNANFSNVIRFAGTYIAA